MHILRQSAEDGVLPLSNPITLTTGESINNLPIPKGLRIVASVAAYNRLIKASTPDAEIRFNELLTRNQQIFGENPHEFDPERWLAPSRVKTDAPLGVYANLRRSLGVSALALGGDLREYLDIVWPEAIADDFNRVLEMQAFLTELIDNFEFSLAPDSHKIRRESCLLMQPTIEGELEKGCQLPLRVSIASRDD
ncbi:hypothetical protein VNI00_004180 [Paramarasmius palmivorus]|uniref:Uncharacterized protein n=1 Tax=Paramarasmius palmivorus TaxID=297713 RepID=A0AAW0DPY2_9AGAR